MQKSLLLLSLFVFSHLSKSQGLLNDGVSIVISAGTSLYVSGGSTNGKYINQTNGSDGAINLDGNMYVEGDWTNNAAGGSVFTSVGTNGTVYLNGSAGQTIGGSRATSFENLNISNATKTLGVTNCSVKGTLTVNAILDLNAKTLLIDNNATSAITLSSNYIKSETTTPGRIQWNVRTATGSFVVPFATASGTSLTMTCNITGAGTESSTGQLEFYTFPTSDDNVPLPTGVTHISYNSRAVMDRFWGLAASGYSANPTSTITFQYDVGDLTGNTGLVEGNLFMQRWSSANSAWQTGGGTVNTGSDNIQRAAVDQYGIMALVNSSTPLPIVLTDFSVSCIEENKQTEVKWTTASEINNEYFTIEKSRDGFTYEQLATVPSQNGNSVTPQDYFYIDSSPYNGSTYYKLKQTDYNGDSETTQPYVVDCIYEGVQPEVYGVNYNSESGNLSFVMTSPTEGNTSYYVSCYDVKGQRLLQEEVSLTKGQNNLTVQTHQLNKGIYFISFMNDTYSGAQKFVVH